jgi:UDP-N-acetylmuramoylalanine--D-glutamate ligase
MIKLDFLADRTVAVLGLGVTGMAAARALAESDATVWAWDDNAENRDAAAAAGVPLVDLYRSDLAAAAAMVTSPGIPLTHPEPHPLVGRARAADCPIIGDGELLCRAQPDATYVGITGTNGKSTTTALIGHILRNAGRECEVGGNLGTPMLALRPLGDGGAYVLELSSFQLELNPSMVLDVAVLLNISADHLERHGGMDGYVAAKRLIFRGQGPGQTAIVGIDDEHSRGIFADLARAGGERAIPISGRAPASGGVFAEGGKLYDQLSAEDRQMVFDLDEARALPGEHNAQNAAAAYAAARAVGVDRQTACAGLRTFPGLAHRQEVVAVVRAIPYVNDSKATNPEAAARALACYDAIYWIAGGRAKPGGLEALEPYLDRVRHAFLGEAMDRFGHALEGGVAVSRCGTLEAAVAAAGDMAERDGPAGAVVLLSPACASFDQFSNFEARGDAFRSLVEARR